MPDLHNTSTVIVPLNYALGAPRLWRKRICWIVLALVVLPTAASLWYWHTPLWKQGRMLYWQHRCMTYTAPADQVVYEENPANAAALLKKADYHSGPIAYCNCTTPAALFVPHWFSAEWAAIVGPYFGSTPYAVLFLHERTSRTGIRRLVVVDVLWVIQGGWDPFGLGCRVFQPVSWRGSPSQVLPYKMYAKYIKYSVGSGHVPKKVPAVHLRFYAGQSDSADAAHFTIRYEMDTSGGRGGGTIDGRLSDDGSYVKFTVRNGPAAPPGPLGWQENPYP